MIKKTGILLISMILTALLTVFSFSLVFAEETAESQSVTQDIFSDSDVQEQLLDSEARSIEQTTEPESTEADYPLLTVNAISNYFPKAIAEYNSTTGEVTVSYWIKLSKDILNIQWYVSYDSSVLAFSEKNIPASICPTIGDNAVVDTDEKDKIKYSSSNIRLFEFSKEEVPFVQLVFDVIDTNDDDPVSTTIDLTIDVLRVSSIDKETNMSDENEEVNLVDNFEIQNSEKTSKVKISSKTLLTPSTYVQPTTSDKASNDELNESTQSEAVTESEALADATSATETGEKTGDSALATPDETADSSSGMDNSVVNTGDTPLAVIFLSIMIVGTGILFVLYKKEVFE